MSQFIFTSQLSKRSSSPIAINYTNTERQPTRETTFLNRTTLEKFIRNDVQLMKYRRNEIIKDFFRVYDCNKLYTMIEVGFDFSVDEKTANIIRKLKRSLPKIKTEILGYVWLVDKGKNEGMHFHLVIATPRINCKGKSLPKELKLTIKNKKVHSSFVESKRNIMNYLLKKKIYYIGKRKRVYGRSLKFNGKTTFLKRSIEE
ncbi:hypothetical protein [Flavobacterium sp.]|uniref:hypothetical protein n=1 Tax=Flavobacterium sp. TaxID=239 RepID=UPI002489397B|nr:hypothetical protein [Flavobacterium sp.]MDI1317914.1 hypothetical protein [Flavobacterium sp.]